MTVFKNKTKQTKQQNHKTLGPIRGEIRKLKGFGQIVAVTGSQKKIENPYRNT